MTITRHFPRREKHILNKLNQAISFESFLHSKYVGQKRFFNRGVDAIIPGLDALIELGASQGVEQFVVGMAHRGRLNVLANIYWPNRPRLYLVNLIVRNTTRTTCLTGM